MRQYVGSTLMVGLALLLGCNQAQQRSCPGPRYYPPGGEVASGPPPAPMDRPSARPFRMDGPGMLPRPDEPNKYLPPASVSPPPDSAPEVSNMRVYARQGVAPAPANVASLQMPPPPPPQPLPQGATSNAVPAQPTPGTLPTSGDIRPLAGTTSNAGSAQSVPEVVLLGVGAESKRETSGMRTVSSVNRSEATLLAPDLRPGSEPAPLPTQPANPGYAHAPDYGWLTGELEHIRAKKVWRLRYAPADQEDRYGGAVQLVRESLPPGCKSGQVVRVEGQVVNPNAGARPPYWVRSFKLIKEAPPEQE